MQAHATALEKPVAGRTARLPETVADLEHFSCALTHGVRAPLRAMQGFAPLLAHGRKLRDPGRDSRAGRRADGIFGREQCRFPATGEIAAGRACKGR